jgi:ankyrin repeat protein
MKKILHILFITAAFICSAFIDCMESPIQAYAPPLPKEIMAYIAGHCRPYEKNILMRLRKDFYECLKNRELIVKTNPSTVSFFDKKRDMFKYTYANNICMMRFLLEHGVKTDIKNILGMTLFHIASDSDCEEAIQLLIDYNVDVNAFKPQIHVFHEAIYKGDVEAVKKWLRCKVNPNLALVGIYTPLMIASYEGHINVIESLLYAGANINDADNDGWTPLIFASRNGYTEIVKLLIGAKAHINDANKNGWTPLMFASRYGHTEIVKLLIDEKVHVNDANNDGLTPLCYASYYGYTETVKLLINAHAAINYASTDGWTPLCGAAYNGNIDIVQLLLDHGADIHVVIKVDYTTDTHIKAGDTPLKIAQKKGHVRIVKLLEARLEKKNLPVDIEEAKNENCIIS